MKHFSFVSILLFFFINAFSQSDFRPGYYITNSNDSVFGLFDYRGDVLNAKVCHYKKDASSAVKEFLPGTIRGYRFIDSKYYVSKELPNDSAKQMVFMEYLIKGKVSVYFRRTYENERMYIEKDGNLAEMNNDESIIQDVEYQDNYYKKTNQYKGVLRVYFQDVPSVFESVNNVEFNKKSIIRISKKYHEKVCIGEQCIIYEKKSPKIIFHYGFYLGSGVHKIKTSFGSYPTFNSNANPILGGFFIQTSVPSISERIFAQLSAGYGSTVYNAKDDQREYHIKHSYVSSSLELLYKIPRKKIKPNFSVGFSYKSLLSYDYWYHWFTDANTMKIPSDYIGKKILGPNAGVGIEIPISSHIAYHFSLNYEYTMSYLGASLDSQNNNFTLSTGILF